MTKNIIIALLSILLIIAEYASTSQAQPGGTVPPCATATPRPTRTPTPTGTATPMIGEPAYQELHWLPQVRAEGEPVP